MTRIRLFQAGLTLVEMTVVVAIIGALLAVAIPAASDWIRGAQLRTMTESVQNGLRTARSTAVAKNFTSGVWFSIVSNLDDDCTLTTAGRNWVISLADPEATDPRCAQNASINVSASDAAPGIMDKWSGEKVASRVTVAASRAQIRFDSFGRVFEGAGATSGSMTVTLSLTDDDGNACAAAGCSRTITVSSGGRIAACDPILATNKGGC